MQFVDISDQLEELTGGFASHKTQIFQIHFFFPPYTFPAHTN